jgi:multiple sugar transport system permease protein
MTQDTLVRPVAQSPPPRPPRRRAPSFRRQGRAAHVFLLPFLLGLVLITAVPLLASLYLSFTDYDLLHDPELVGLENFRRMAEDGRFWASVGVTLKYVLVSVPLQLAFALLLAVVLDKGMRGLALYRSVYYLPSLLGGSVAIAILWRQIFAGDGLVNKLLAMFDIAGPSWISNPKTSLWTLIILSIWQFGSPMIIFLAGLRQVPQDMYEAASLDGAGPTRQFFKITLPLLTPVIFFNAVVQTIEAFKAFTPAFIISEGTGGPVNSTLFYTLYLYLEAFAFLRMGYASALAWVLVLIVAVFTAFSFLSARYWVHYDD